MGDGDVAAGTVRAFAAGVIDIPWSPNRFVKSRVLPARDADGYLRILDPGLMPIAKDVLEIHADGLRRRAARERIPVDDTLAISSVFEMMETLEQLAPPLFS
jgi:methylaspartate mutase epsilon subunit